MLLSVWFKILFLLLRILARKMWCTFRNRGSGVWNDLLFLFLGYNCKVDWWFLVMLDLICDREGGLTSPVVVRYFIPLESWHWKTIFGVGLMNLKMLSFKELELAEFRIAGSYFTQLWLMERKHFCRSCA